LLHIHDGWDFAEVLAELDEAGYDAIWQVLNSKDFGVPQSRERVFVIANFRSRGDEKYYLSPERTAMLLSKLSPECKDTGSMTQAG
jgi:DNA (cytosine-5)-methyltransferase 1